MALTGRSLDIAMAYIVMAHVVMACSYGLNSYGPYSYGADGPESGHFWVADVDEHNCLIDIDDSHLLYLGITDGMPIARVWTRRYSK